MVKRKFFWMFIHTSGLQKSIQTRSDDSLDNGQTTRIFLWNLWFFAFINAVKRQSRRPGSLHQLIVK
jgi:hypothetical protein